MNWVDLVLAVVGIFALYQGYKMGLVGALCNLVGLFVGIWVAANFNDVIMLLYFHTSLSLLVFLWAHKSFEESSRQL